MKRIGISMIWLFDPVKTTWTTKYDLEQWVGRHLAMDGLQAERLEILGMDQMIVVINSKDDVKIPTPPKVGRPISLKTHIEQLKPGKTTAKERDFRKGQFLSRKGYLKK